MTTNTNNSKFYMNDHIFRGMFDSDGSVIFGIQLVPREKAGFKVQITLTFEFEQSLENRGNADAVAEFLRIKVKTKHRYYDNNKKTVSYVVRGTFTSSVGKKIMEIYEKSPPHAIVRYKQMKVIQEILNFKRRPGYRTQQEHVAMMRLIQFVVTKKK